MNQVNVIRILIIKFIDEEFSIRLQNWYWLLAKKKGRGDKDIADYIENKPIRIPEL